MIYAGFWRRFAALLIDSLILIVPSAIMGLILPYVGSLLIVVLYYPFFVSSELMGTPGKVFMGMAVTMEDGSRMSFKNSMIRYLLSLLSGLFLCVGYLFNLFTPKRQTFHDLMVGSVVIRRAEVSDIDWVAAWLKEFKRVLKIGQEAINAVDLGGTASADKTASGNLATLENLHKLFQQGVLTEEEYNRKKQEILNKI